MTALARSEKQVSSGEIVEVPRWVLVVVSDPRWHLYLGTRVLARITKHTDPLDPSHYNYFATTRFTRSMTRTHHYDFCGLSLKSAKEWAEAQILKKQ